MDRFKIQSYENRITVTLTTRYPEPGEIWMGNFVMTVSFTPTLISAVSNVKLCKKNTVLIISKTDGMARDKHGVRQTKNYLIALGLCEGKIVGIEDIDISDPCIGLTRIA